MEGEGSESGMSGPVALSDLPKPLRKTLSVLTDVSMLNQTAINSGLDLPLGRLDKSCLVQASQALEGIKTALEELEELQKGNSDGRVDAARVESSNHHHESLNVCQDFDLIYIYIYIHPIFMVKSSSFNMYHIYYVTLIT